jgi:hypothetical protein
MQTKTSIKLLLALLALAIIIVLTPYLTGIVAQRQLKQAVKSFNDRSQSLQLSVDHYKRGFTQSQASLQLRLAKTGEAVIDSLNLDITHGPAFYYHGHIKLGLAKMYFDLLGQEQKDEPKDSFYLGLNQHIQGTINLHVPDNLKQLFNFDEGKIKFATGPHINSFNIKTKINDFNTSSKLKPLHAQTQSLVLDITGDRTNDNEWQLYNNLSLSNFSQSYKKSQPEDQDSYELTAKKIKLGHLRIDPKAWFQAYFAMQTQTSADDSQQQGAIVRDLVTSMVDNKTALTLKQIKLHSNQATGQLHTEITWPNLPPNHRFVDLSTYARVNLSIQLPHVKDVQQDAKLMINKLSIDASKKTAGQAWASITLAKLLYQQKQQDNFLVTGLDYQTGTNLHNESISTNYDWQIEKLCWQNCFNNLEGSLAINNYNATLQKPLSNAIINLMALTFAPQLYEHGDINMFFTDLQNDLSAMINSKTSIKLNTKGALKDGPIKLRLSFKWPDLPNDNKEETLFQHMRYTIKAKYPKSRIDDVLSAIAPKANGNNDKSTQKTFIVLLAQKLRSMINQGDIEPQDGLYDLKIDGKGTSATVNGQKVALKSSPAT